MSERIALPLCKFFIPATLKTRENTKEKFQRSTFWGLFQWNQAIKKRVINPHGISSFLTYWFCDMWLISVFFIYRILKANHDREKAKKEKRKMKQEKKKQ